MATAKVVPLKKEPTLGQLIDKLAEVEERRTSHAALGNKHDAEKTDLQTRIFEALDAQETLTASSKTRRISVSESPEPRTLDWEQGLEWLAKNNLLRLLYRRISAPSWRELKEVAMKDPKLAKKMIPVKAVVDGKERVVDYEIPGFETFMVRKLSFTKV